MSSVGRAEVVAGSASGVEPAGAAARPSGRARSASERRRAAASARRAHPAGVHLQAREQLGGLRRRDHACAGASSRAAPATPRARRRGPLVDRLGGGEVQLRRRARRRERGAADQHGEHRVVLAAAWSTTRPARPPARAARRSPAGRAGQDVVGDLAAARRCSATSASPTRVTGARRCATAGAAPGRAPRGPATRLSAATRARRRRSAASSAGRRGCRRRRRTGPGSAGAAPSGVARRRARRSASCAALRPKVIGTACWVSVRPGHHAWPRCASASAASAADLRVAAPRGAARARRARSSTSAVSRTSWLVSPRCSQRAASASRRQPLAQQRDQRDHRVAARLGAAATLVRSTSVDQLVEGARPAVGRDARARPARASHAASTPTIAPSSAASVEQVAGPVVARPEQVGHRVSVPG